MVLESSFKRSQKLPEAQFQKNAACSSLGQQLSLGVQQHTQFPRHKSWFGRGGVGGTFGCMNDT